MSDSSGGTVDMGYASAVDMALFALILAFTIVQWLASRRSEINGWKGDDEDG